ncbi:MAG: NUDIX hydrolase [Candidatus Micrarchaeales archaeon]
MSNEELLDIFNEKMEHIGTATRGEVHKKGYWHKTFNCWIVRCEKDKTYLLFQLRAKNKAWFPNRLDATAGGHILAGERIEDSVRELKEEIGVKATLRNLVFLGIRADPFMYNGLINNEFYYTYLLEHYTPLSDYDIQAEELAGIFQMEIKEGMRLFTNQITKLELIGVKIEKGKKKMTKLEVSTEDFVESVDNYYLKILIMAERYFENKRPISI